MAGLELGALVSQAGLQSDVPLAAAALGPGSSVVEYASGNWPGGRAVQPSDRFYAASLAKQVTAAAIAVLVQQRVIDPDAPLGDWLTDLPDWAGRSTVRQTLHHIGGFPEAGILEAQLGGADWTDATALALLGACPAPAMQAGSAFVYSNVGYICLAQLVATAGGASFAQEVERMITTPLALHDMSFSPPERIVDYPQARWLGPTMPRSYGDGGLWTTAPAFARWLDHQNHDRLNIATLTECGAALPGGRGDYGWGIGLRKFGNHALFVHGGSWQRAQAKALRCPAIGLGIVVLSADTKPQRIDRLSDLILEALAET